MRAKTVDLSLLPKGGPDPKLTLPAVQRNRLSNGLDVLVVEHRELPVVNLNLVVKSGGASDPAIKGGLAQLTADLLDEGTLSRSSVVIADQLSGIGASLSLTAGWDSTTASLRTLTRHLDAALDLYADVITNPAFPDQELARLRDTRLATLKLQRDNPDAVAGIVVQRVLYGRDHTYGHPLSGDEASLESITRQDARAFYDAHVRPNNAALIVVGDVSAADVVAKLEKAFASWKPGQTRPDLRASRRHRATVPESTSRPPRFRPVGRPGRQVGMPRNTPDFFPLQVMNRILGGATSARLYMNLRQDKGYTYGATSAFSYRRDAGPFVAQAAVQGFSTRESVIEFLKELHGIRGGIPVSPEEIESARQASSGASREGSRRRNRLRRTWRRW